MVRAPWLAGETGRTEENLVQLFDVVPTALDLAGIDPLHVHFAQTLIPYLDGTSGAKGGEVGEMSSAKLGAEPRDEGALELRPV